MNLQPYLHFNGRCEEALKFYQDAVGLKTESLMRFKEAPDQSRMPPGTGEHVMHSSSRLGDSVLMASDGMGADAGPMSGFSLSVGVATAQEGRKVFDALKAGGQVTMDFAPTFWTAGFGMLVDRFGVSWMVNVEHGE